MYPSMVFALLVAVILANGAHAHDKGVRLSLSGMGLTNSSEQGGSGPAGSTILTHSELIYHGLWWGLGAFAQYDKQGSNETDLGVGPKLELHAKVFYIESGYAFLMQRSFTDRSIAKQTGKSWFIGAGARFSLGASSSSTGGSGFFLQFSYKYRTQTVEKQDSTVLDEKIIQKDGYPLFGIGFKF